MSQIKKFTPIMWVIAVLAVLLLGAIVFSVFQVTSLKHQVNVAQAENEQLQLTNEQLSLSNEFEAINSEFRQYEKHNTFHRCIHCRWRA